MIKDKGAIQKLIISEIEATQILVAKYRELTKPISPENAIGRISRMDAINNKSVIEATLRKSEIKLNNLKVALSKLDDNDFGICIKCKQEIPLGRILLIPHAVTCVRCSN